MHIKFFRIFYILLLAPMLSSAQPLITAGPMLGYIEYRTANIWVEVAPRVKDLRIYFWEKESTTHKRSKLVGYAGEYGREFNTITAEITNLRPGTTYEYELIAYSGSDKEIKTGSFTTQEQWAYRKPAPDISFLTGSCSYMNQPEYDRPGEPYGGDSSIFITMSETKADFMLWLGDNWYTRDVDYYSKWGLWYRAHHDRKQPVLQPLLAAMPNYAIWDDHDYGPNNFGASYIFKDETRKVFKNYWANPTYGMDGKGIYTQFAYSDVAFFLLDDRTWRSPDDMKDSVKGQPNPEKTMFGKEQLAWLKDALLQSRYATFKIIATGSQMLNTYSPYDCFYHYPVEFKELTDFITENKIEGVIFLTGDRHHSEIIKMERPGHYTLYDVTVSPLTSHRYAPGGAEKDMLTRVKMIDLEQNFARINVTGEGDKRKLTVQFFGLKGKDLGAWTVKAADLKEK